MPRARATRSIVARAGDVLLTLAAVAGALCLVLVVAAGVFQVGIVLFRTGSMGPTIPAGSAALVREVPASSLAIGDVVTVDRPGRLPVTHRIVAIDDGSGPELRRLTLRGDANPVDDPAPYDVATARIVLFSVPGAAPVIAAFGDPLVLGSLTVGATALVVWAFWPRRPRTARPPRGRTGADAPQQRDGPKHREDAVTGAGAGVALLVAASVGAAVLAPASPARAAVEETVVQGEVLRLVSIGDPQAMTSLSPGGTAVWEVGVTADAPTPGTISVTLSGTGSSALGLVGDVAWCAEPWDATGCPAPTTVADALALPVDGEQVPLLTMSSDDERWLRFAVRMTPGAEPPTGLATLVVRATGSGDDASIGPPGAEVPEGLGGTGVPAGPGLVVAAVLAIVGAILTAIARRSRRPVRSRAVRP
ncbi:hypothetical protein MUN74_09720 [Agromyces endophyticus]|uniref:hypothetical protein n=1 Tax=Agromyces sp. H17E-10 TaxID=2932244 RepID=UPI001FD205A4|nr:hypothetical protein [Agromyces sp. H17E-10]UOQ87599.1 hypothetical protein MUN74_09720 [Agromyces sp. H17E-10]